MIEISDITLDDFTQKQFDAYKAEVTRLTKQVNIPAMVKRFVIEAAIRAGFLHGLENVDLKSLPPVFISQLKEKVVAHIKDAFTVPASVILDAADCVTNKDTKPPKELSLLWECQMWNTLPKGICLEDIPVKIRVRTNAAYKIYNAVKNWHLYSSDKKWLSDNIHILETLDYIDELREKEQA